MKLLTRQSRESFEAGNTQRRKILSMAHELGWSYLGRDNKMVADIERINRWCNEYGYLRKPLNYYTPDELPRLVTQFQNMYVKTLRDNAARERMVNRMHDALKDVKP